MNSYRKFLTKLRKKQSKVRFRHSVAVGELAAKLGRKYGWDPDRARLAGLLHDYAKQWAPQKLIRYAKTHRLKIPSKEFILATSPNMLHAYVSADVVRQKKWIGRKSDLNAIASHTLGSLHMGLEEKILYVADFAAKGRAYPSAQRVRNMAMVDLEKAFREALALKIIWQFKKIKVIHPLPISVWNKVVCGVNS